MAIVTWNALTNKTTPARCAACQKKLKSWKDLITLSRDGQMVHFHGDCHKVWAKKHLGA